MKKKQAADMAEKNHGARAHSTISPSGFTTIDPDQGGCPGFVRPVNEKPHPVTVLGEKLHELMDREDLTTLVDSPKYQELDIWDKRAINFCLESLNEVTDGLIGERVLCEPRLEIMPLPDGEIMTGHVDRVHLYEEMRTAYIFDWKFGWTPVEDPETNWQGILYAYGIFNSFPWLESVFVTFICPRLKTFKTAKWTPQTLTPKIARAMTLLRIAYEHSSPETWVYNEVNCSRCARVCCPKVGQIGVDLATRFHNDAISFDDPDAPDVTAGFPLKIVDPRETDDPDELGRMLNLSRSLVAWAKLVEETALSVRMEKGIDITGWEMKERRPNLVVKATNEAITLLEDKLKLNPAVLVAASKLSFPKIISFVKSKYGLTTEEAQAKVYGILKEANLLSEGEPTNFLSPLKKKPSDFVVQ